MNERTVIKDDNSPSGFSILDKNKDGEIITPLQYGEMSFLLQGGFGNLIKRDINKLIIGVKYER